MRWPFFSQSGLNVTPPDPYSALCIGHFWRNGAKFWNSFCVQTGKSDIFDVRRPPITINSSAKIKNQLPVLIEEIEETADYFSFLLQCLVEIITLFSNRIRNEFTLVLSNKCTWFYFFTGKDSIPCEWRWYILVLKPVPLSKNMWFLIKFDNQQTSASQTKGSSRALGPWGPGGCNDCLARRQRQTPTW